MTHKTEKDIFFATLDFDSADERIAYVNEACGENKELHASVMALLRQHEKQSPIDTRLSVLIACQRRYSEHRNMTLGCRL